MTARLIACLIAGVALAIALGATARADDTPETETAASEAARQHFARGTDHFNLGEFDEALTEFRAAYSLSSAPGLLFNMAQACRAARRYSLAEHYYRDYLRLVPDAHERDYVQARLDEMARRQRTGTDPKPSPAAAKARATDGGAEPTTAREVDHGRSKRIVGLAAAGAGVALLATALYVGSQAAAAGDDVSRAFREGAVYDEELAARYEQGRSDERLAIAGASLGAGLIIGGAVLWYFGVRDVRRVPAVAPAPTQGGGRLVMTWTF